MLEKENRIEMRRKKCSYHGSNTMRLIIEGACEMLERIVRDGGVSFPRTGETYPDFDICKLCSFLVFKKPKEGDE